MIVIPETANENYLVSAFDQSSFCKFNCQIVIASKTIKLVVFDEESVKTRLKQCSKHDFFHEKKSVFALVIDINRVNYVKIQDCVSYIICDSQLKNSIILTFSPYTTAQFQFIKNICHDETFTYLREDYYGTLFPDIHLNNYRRLFTVQGHNVPIYYVNTRCKNFNSSDLSQYPELELIKRELHSDYDTHYEKVKTEIKKKLGSTLCTNLNRKLFLLHTFDDQMRVFSRLRHTQQSR